MKKILKGCFELDHSVNDISEYEKLKMSKIQSILDWGDKFGIAIRFGTNDEGDYLCEYKILGATIQYCKGMKSELKDMLKCIWKKPTVCFEMTGETIY